MKSPDHVTDAIRYLSLAGQQIPVHSPLRKGKPFGPEPIGYEPSRHPIRRWLWLKGGRMAHRVEDWSFGLYCWLIMRAGWFDQNALDHDPKPIYAPDAWELYRMITFGPSPSIDIDADIIGVDVDGNYVRRSETEGARGR